MTGSNFRVISAVIKKGLQIDLSTANLQPSPLPEWINFFLSFQFFFWMFMFSREILDIFEDIDSFHMRLNGFGIITAKSLRILPLLKKA